MPETSVDIADETFIAAAREEVVERLTAPTLWRAWWPGLHLRITLDRGLDGMSWSVTGALTGTAEIWLEPWHDGVIVHWFLRASPHEQGDTRRVRDAQAIAYKRRITALKDELERRRPAGMPRGSTAPVVSGSPPTTGP